VQNTSSQALMIGNNQVKKNIITISTLIFSIAVSSHALAANVDACHGTQLSPCIVQDTFDNSAKVKYLRDAKMITESYKGNIAGLDRLWVSASNAPSEPGWEVIAVHIENATQGKVKK
jgi:hypothetical protein